MLLDEITTIDKALTRPWTVTKKYGRDPKEALDWAEENCAEGNGHVEIQGQGYFLSGDGNLMPSRRTSRRPTCASSSSSNGPRRLSFRGRRKAEPGTQEFPGHGLSGFRVRRARPE